MTRYWPRASRGHLRLSSAELSYWVYLSKDHELRWLDRASTPPISLRTEPDTGLMQRASTR